MRRCHPLLVLAAVAASGCGSSSSDSKPEPKGPFEAPTVVVTGQLHPHALVHDSGKLYWLTEQGAGGESLSSASDEGGAIETLAASAGPFALHAQTVYFFDGDSSLFQLSLGGGAATTLSSGLDTVTSVAADATGVYFGYHDSEGYGRVEVLPPGASEPTYLSTVHRDPAHLVLDEAAVYFEASGIISRLEKQNGAELELATSTAEALALDEANVYWATIHNGSVRRVPKQGGETELLSPHLDHPRDVAVDASHVYFTSSGSGLVARISRTSGELELLATNQVLPYDVALSADRVFWTDRETGTISYVSK